MRCIGKLFAPHIGVLHDLQYNLPALQRPPSAPSLFITRLQVCADEIPSPWRCRDILTQLIPTGRHHLSLPTTVSLI